MENNVKGDTSKSNISRERWKILRSFIKNHNLNVTHKYGHAFGLFTSSVYNKELKGEIENYQESDYEWLDYTCEQFPSCQLAVRQRVRAVNWNDATVFDNTGNICVWPSEEILSYLCIKNSQDFKDKTVCELGAGMTGLAGMMLAIASDVKKVVITDGNMDSILSILKKVPISRLELQCIFVYKDSIFIDLKCQDQDLKKIKKANQKMFGESEVDIRQLKWDVKDDYKDLENSFECILNADCLFYEKNHENLLDVIRTLLKSDGIALIISPSRGLAVENFIEKAQKLFHCDYRENYDEFIWSAYCQEKERLLDSEAVRNFPVLLKMTKKC